MEYFIDDADLGRIIVHVNVRAKRIIARKKDNQLHLTVPKFASSADIRGALERMKPKIAHLRTVEVARFDENYALQTFSFRVEIGRNELSKIYLNLKDGLLKIAVPSSINIYQDSIQEQIRSLIERVLRHEANRLLPARVKELADKHRFDYIDVKINKSKSRWGSCSSKRNINLSLYCMLLPSHLLDSVILHELCHTKEMNHSSRFWTLMDSVTNNQSEKFRKELRNYTTSL